MDIFWFLILALFASINYLLGLSRPTFLNAFLFYGSIMAIGALFFVSGIDVPGRGIDLSSPTQILYLSNSYTYDNNAFVKGATVLCVFIGVWGFWKIILKAWSGELKKDGTFT